MVVWALSMLLLVFEGDIGTSAVFMGLFVAMLYIATGRRSWAILGFLMFIVGAVAAGTLVPHVQSRFSSWLHPFSTANLVKYPQPSYQLVQGMYGMGNGGLLGKGLGGGQPFWTPLVQNDSIFTAFGEEIGLAGVMALLLLYGLFVQRGLRTAMLVKDDYSKLLASGLSFMFALQVFVIVGGVTRLIPFTGITTPFLSQGGSSLIASWLLVAVIARLSDAARRPAPQADPGRGDDPGGDAPVTGMNRPIKRIALAALVMFVILLVDVNYLQAVEAPSLANRPENNRTAYEQNRVQRGNIVTADGVTIASSKPSTRPVPVAAPVRRRTDLRAGHRLRHDLLAGAGAQLRHRRRARRERPADRHRLAARVPQLHRHAHQQAAEGRDRPGHDQLQGPASRLPAAAGHPAGQDHQRQAAGRRRGRAEPVHRRDPGHGLLPEL